jgi:hypothetical protein
MVDIFHWKHKITMLKLLSLSKIILFPLKSGTSSGTGIDSQV